MADIFVSPHLKQQQQQKSGRRGVFVVMFTILSQSQFNFSPGYSMASDLVSSCCLREVCPFGRQMMDQGVGFLLPIWGARMEFLAFGFSLA